MLCRDKNPYDVVHFRLRDTHFANGERYMWSTVIGDTKHPTDYQLRRVTIDLTREDIRQETVQCQDLDDFLGGIARSFKLFAHYEVQDAFASSAPLISSLSSKTSMAWRIAWPKEKPSRCGISESG
jgi:hypothetical protein